MEKILVNTDYGNVGGEVVKKSSKNFQIRLMGHCIICLRKVSLKRPRISETSDYIEVNYANLSSARPEIASKSVVTSTGFLVTFNQVWTVLQGIWNDKKKNNDRSSMETGICLENALAGCMSTSTNVSFSRAPTICQVCCDKVVAVENLMKAVRQQVREISMLLEEGRRRQKTGSGGVGEFEKNLRDNGLEESVIQATLKFVGIFGKRCSQAEFQVSVKKGEDVIGSDTDTSVMMESNDQDQDSLRGGQDDGDYNDDEDEIVESSGDSGDPDYIKEESNQGGKEEDNSTTDEKNESEEEMEVDEEDKNYPDYDGLEKDSLSVPAGGQRDKLKYNAVNRRKRERSNGQEESERKLVCSCGERFGSRKSLRRHMSVNRTLHPEYKPFQGTALSVGNRQICELCGQWVMFTDICEHLTEIHLNGKDEWMIRCPNDKCRYVGLTKKQFNEHFSGHKECRVRGKEKWEVVCETCGLKGTNMLVIRNHLRDKHENGRGEEEKKWECPISGCGKRFCVRQSVQEHLYEHRRRPPITQQNCDKCGGKFKVEEMEVHLRGEHGMGEVIGCGQCEMRFSGREEMVEHLYEHRGVGITCDICGGDEEIKFVSKYSDFREHYFGVHGLCPKRYKCGDEGCDDKWYWRREDKEEHELRVHKDGTKNVRYRNRKENADGKSLECDVCGNKYLKEYQLLNHKIKIHGAEPFKCDICGESFDGKLKFNKHKKEHAGIPVKKEWRCEGEGGCGKIFKEKYAWKHHVEVMHGGKRSHVCEECGKGFGLAASLRKHRDSVHLKLKPWVCEECGERFGSSGVLKKHKLIHTGERPFGCEICGQRFRHKEVLKTHVKGHEEKGAGFKPNGPMKQIRKRKGE